MTIHLQRIALAIVLLLLAGSGLRGQESVRDLEKPGQYYKFLTPGQVDQWILAGEKGETITAHVTSREFDAVLELASKEDKVLVRSTDTRNECRFSFRLPENGQYTIRVHADKNQGGGNYHLTVSRFQASPIVVGTPLIGVFDQEGRSYHYFQAMKDQVVIVDAKGTAAETWQILDVKGRDMPRWSGTVPIEENGEHSLVLSGQPGQPYDLVVRKARRRELAEGKDDRSTLQPGEMDLWSFQGKPGEFRLLEVDKKGELASRLVYAPPARKDKLLSRPGEQPPINLLPVASRGGRLQYAAILGREGKYELHLLARTPVSYTLKMRDPSKPIEWGKEVQGSLPVGASAFYSFRVAPGQLLQASLTSREFVPLLRLSDAQGKLVQQHGDADALEGRINNMMVKGGLYRLQVSSSGDGGGGNFRLALKETKAKVLKVGDRSQGTLQPGATDFWNIQGQEGKTVILSVRSLAFNPVVKLHSPDGVQLASGDNGSPGTGRLFAVRLPRTGQYTLWISSERGAGEYALRIIDGD